MTPWLTSDVYASYKQYKDNEKSVIQWIVDNSQPDLNMAQQTTTVKPDARNADVAIHKILSLVRKIATKTEPVRMPPYIVTRLYSFSRRRTKSLQ